jgi:hypothetical protein
LRLLPATAFEPEANIVNVGIGAVEVVSAAVVSVVKSVAAEVAEVSMVMDESAASVEEAVVSAEDTEVSTEDSTTAEEVADTSSVVDATEVTNEVSVAAPGVAAEVVVAETNLISALNQIDTVINNTHEACMGLQQQTQ